jgi:hypothetical protein
VQGKVFAGAFHFDQEARLPNQVNELFSLRTFLGDPSFERRASFLVASMPKRLKKAVAKDLGFALFVCKGRRVLNECFQTVNNLGQRSTPNLASGIHNQMLKPEYQATGPYPMLGMVQA